MEFRILGLLEAEEDGRLLRLGGPLQRALLALLLLHANEVVPRERLIDELWGAERPETARTALQVHVSQLRKILGSERIVTRAPGYLLRTEPQSLDLERFESLVQEGSAALAARDPWRAARTLREALSLWRGTPLADLDAARFAERARLRLEELRLGALEERIEADLALGRHRELVLELEALLAEHPLRERLRGQLMLALYRSGRQAEALELYRQGRRLLSDELGLEPGEELRRVERAILAQDAAIAAPAARVGVSAPTGTVTFVFTDIEGSTRLVQELADDYGELLERHHALLRDALGAEGGHEVDSQGDAFFFAFRRARDAVQAAVRAQLAVTGAPWPREAEVRIRIGIHTGEPGVLESGYHGLDVVRAARISGAAAGGQILVSSATRGLVGQALSDVSFRDLGEYRLKDVESAERLFQVVAPGLREEFPDPRTEDGARVMTIGGREKELAAAAEAVLGAEERRVRLLQRSRLVVAAGALVLIAAAVALAIALTEGGSPVTVTADSVAVLDAEEGKVTDSIRLGAKPGALAVGLGSVWVAHQAEGTVSRIDAESGDVVTSIGVGAPVVDVAVGAGAVWTANGEDGTVSRIDPQTNSVSNTLDLRGGDELAPNETYAVAFGEGSLWVARGPGEVLRIQPDTGRIRARIDVGTQAATLDIGETGLWVATVAERVIHIEPRTNEIVARIAIGFPQALDEADGSVWVSDGELGPPSAAGRLLRIDPDTATASQAIPLGAVPLAIAAGGGSVWVMGFDGMLRIDPATGQIAKTIPLDYVPWEAVLAEGVLWVSVVSSF